MDYDMESDNSSMLMEDIIRENGNMVAWKDQELFIIPVIIQPTQDNGRMTNSTVKVLSTMNNP